MLEKIKSFFKLNLEEPKKELEKEKIKVRASGECELIVENYGGCNSGDYLCVNYDLNINFSEKTLKKKDSLILSEMWDLHDKKELYQQGIDIVNKKGLNYIKFINKLTEVVKKEVYKHMREADEENLKVIFEKNNKINIGISTTVEE